MSPHYRTFYPLVGISGTVTPTDNRGFFLFRWIPYFSGTEIVLEIKVNTRQHTTYAIDELNYEWRLFKDTSENPQYTGNGILKHNIFYNKNTLTTILKLPFLIGISHYKLEIRISMGEYEVLDWKPIFDFELHSGDRLLFGIILPIFTFIIGMVILAFIQKSCGILMP